MKLAENILPEAGVQRRILRVAFALESAFDACLSPDKTTLSFFETPGAIRYVELPATLDYLAKGDIVRLDVAQGSLRVLYRKASPHNFLFFTERCNSRCLMCSQPPRDINDDYLIDDILEAIPLMSPDTEQLGITGGEPTLVGDRLLDVLDSIHRNLPRTAVHMLTNGRNFERGKLAADIGNIGLADLMLGVPLYSDTASRHDFVVQARGAFDETIRGLYNLARFEVPIEIRFVTHAQTVDRLPQTARYIARNLPFVRQVAFMGLEMTGFARSNVGALWIEAEDYVDKLAEAVDELPRSITPFIYNHPLCVLPRKLWPYSRQSISDWKNIYHDECGECAARTECGGFFASSEFRRIEGIKPFSVADLAGHPV